MKLKALPTNVGRPNDVDDDDDDYDGGIISRFGFLKILFHRTPADMASR